jgi:undecaprenyl-diphosphatase
MAIIIEAIILGIVQGLTEFLPVSSSGHLILFPWFFGWTGEVDSLAFGVALHTGTLIALLTYFRKELIPLVTGLGSGGGMMWRIVVGCIPAGIVGVLFHDGIEELRYPLLVAFMLASVAVLMLVVERRFIKGRSFDEITFKDAFFIGMAQSLALIPGTSRSGITITAGLAAGINREAAARFSFLISMPLVAGASLLEGYKLIKHNTFDHALFIIGIVTSAITGYLAIKFLLIFFKTYSLRVFAYYRFVLASVIILYWLLLL